MATIANMPMRNLGHFNSIERGLWLYLIDQMRECIATPIVMAALINAITMYPYSNFLLRPPWSQFMSNENLNYRQGLSLL